MPLRCFTLLCLLLSSQVVIGTERCGYRDVESLETRENVERSGGCFPFDTSSLPQGTPCDDIYTKDVTYVYLSSQRAGGDYLRYVNIFGNTEIYFSILRESCNTLARKIACHYYLPPCGNSTVFEPPTSVCEDVCVHLRSLCPTVFEQLRLHLLTYPLLEQLGIEMINCSNTGDYVTPLQHCCTDLDIDIPCMEVNESSGELESVTECHISSSSYPTLPAPSVVPTPIFTSKKQSSQVVGVSVGVTAAVLVTILIIVTISLLALLRVRKKRRHFGKQTEQYITSHESSQSKGSLRYHDRDVVHLAPPSNVGTGQRVARVPSAYIRQMGDEKLLIPGRSLTLMDTIGQGEFGVVYRGNLTGWRAKRGDSLVAIKTLKGIFSIGDLSSMMEESVTMAKFDHPNVMRLIGVCIDKGPSPYIVMPYMAYGSLLSYLKKQRAELTLANDNNQELVTTTQCKLLSICLQVAKGMSYLASQQFVHRDLAARNCMIDEKFVLKVADFGLSEDIYARNYFRQTGMQENGEEAPIKLPVRWMAMESLHDGVFTEKTDVWSYGVTVWEIFSGGRNPYPGVDPFTLMKYLDNGGRLEKPGNAACSQEIYTLMSECWNTAPENRPYFSSLVTTFTSTLESIAGYMEFSPTGWSSTTTDPSNVFGYDHLSPPPSSPPPPPGHQEICDETEPKPQANPTVIISCEEIDKNMTL